MILHIKSIITNGFNFYTLFKFECTTQKDRRILKSTILQVRLRNYL